MGVSRVINHFEACASAYRTTSILMVERARSQLLKDQQDLPLKIQGEEHISQRRTNEPPCEYFTLYVESLWHKASFSVGRNKS